MNFNVNRVVKGIIITLLTISSIQLYAQPLNQKKVFNRQDTLRGTNGEFRKNWDVLHYEITVKPDYNTKTIIGNNRMTFYDNGAYLMQVDLQQPMILDSAINGIRQLPIRREGNVYWVLLRDTLNRQKIKIGQNAVTFYFHGKPVEAKRPPWDGGWIWKKDKLGRPWMSVACQGLGASVWYPCKDIQSDEPDKGATLNIIVPDTLMAIGNGRMKSKETAGNGYMLYSWTVKNPINNYNIVPYIGKYTHFSETYPGEKGKLDLDYWVLDYNSDTAKKQFADVPRMLKAFEHWFGPYPFYEDGFKLVESPHLGMEHQSAIAYGNNYQKGYRGSDLSGTGWGMKWDFIIVHESGHEWFANNITTNDIADMWVHEGFTNYSETLFTDYFYGTAAGNEYVIGTRKAISNDIPIIGLYGLNKEGSGDMYYKAGNMLHSIRQVIDNDKKFRNILRGLNKNFYHKTVTTQQVESYISSHSKKDFSRVFEQYLRTVKIPVLEYKINGTLLSYRYTNCVSGFNLPLKVSLDAKKEKWLKPTTDWKTLTLSPLYDGSTFKVNENFFVEVKKV
ncbi:MAG: M1 family metallopeptidase [Ferruginibacter sp.]